MKAKGVVCLLGAVLVLGFVIPGAAGERALEKEVVVNASLVEVWNAWTTEKGAETFLGPKTNIDPTVGGHYEVYFAPDQPYGFRGADDGQVQSIVPMKSLAFTWNAPANFGVLRSLHTIVVLRFEELGPKRTKVRFSQIGWGNGEMWDKLFAYFDHGWDVILRRLQWRFENGPVDWKNPPMTSNPAKFTEEAGGKAVRAEKWFAILYTPRPDLVQAVIENNIPEKDQRIVAKHFGYLNSLKEAGQLVMVGRTMAGKVDDFGIAVLQVGSETEARELMENDPGVKEGFFRAELRPFSLALLSGKK